MVILKAAIFRGNSNSNSNSNNCLGAPKPTTNNNKNSKKKKNSKGRVEKLPSFCVPYASWKGFPVLCRGLL